MPPKTMGGASNMKAFVVLSAALMLTACASTRTVLAKPPTEVFQTDRSPEDVTFCLGNKNEAPVLPQRNGSSVVLLKNGYGAVLIAFTIIPDDQGSRVELRKEFGAIGGIWKQCVGLKEEK
jgi:uncharacterized protein (DUF58 family)